MKNGCGEHRLLSPVSRPNRGKLRGIIREADKAAFRLISLLYHKACRPSSTNSPDVLDAARPAGFEERQDRLNDSSIARHRDALHRKQIMASIPLSDDQPSKIVSGILGPAGKRMVLKYCPRVLGVWLSELNTSGIPMPAASFTIQGLA